MSSYTFVMIKPSSIQYIDEIKKILEKNGFEIKKSEFVKLTQEKTIEFYSAHKERSFFSELCEYIAEKTMYAMLLEHKSDDAISIGRKLVGHTDPKKAEDGTIRKMFGRDISDNAIHASDSKESFIIESGIVFGNDC